MLFATSASAEQGAPLPAAAPGNAADTAPGNAADTAPGNAAGKVPGTVPSTSGAVSRPEFDEAAVARISSDERYKFGKTWVAFASDYRRTAVLFRPIAFAEPAPPRYPRPLLNLKSECTPGTKEASFLPTDGASLSKINDEHLSLNGGAVIVRASQKPVFVSQTITGQKVMTRIARGALVMVSNIDGHSTVLNLGESCCGALMCYVPAADGKGLSAVSIPAGQILEVLPTAAPDTIKVLSRDIFVDKPCSNEVRMLQGHCDYPLALQRYNLLSVLDATYPPPPPATQPAANTTTPATQPAAITTTPATKPVADTVPALQKRTPAP